MSLFDGWLKARVPISAKLIQLYKTIDSQKIVNGSIWFDGKWLKLAHRGKIDVIPGLSFLPKGIIGGKPPVWTSATTITIPAGTKCIDSTGKHMAEFTQAQAVVITAIGANGLDSAYSEAVDKHYCLYAIWDSNGVNAPMGMFSEVNESVTGSITLPAGYDVKCQMPYTVRNDGAGNFIPQWVAGGWPYAPELRFEVAFSSSAGAGTTQALNAGASVSFADITNMPKFTSPLSTTAILNIVGSRSTTNRDIYVRRKGESHNGSAIRVVVDSTIQYIERIIQTNSSQMAEYKLEGAGANATIDVVGSILNPVY
jgi:hypothetical protein